MTTHLDRLHDLPCIICEKMGMKQTTPTVAHHLEVVRDENTDYAAIAICDDHHRMLHAMSRRSFETLTKLQPVDMLALTIKQMDKAGLLA